MGDNVEHEQVEGANLAEGPATVKEARVRLYGCLAPVEGEEVVRQQLRAAHRYQNDLIALERCRREVYRELRAKHCPTDALDEEVKLLVDKLAELRTAIKAERKQQRRRVVVQAMDQQCKAAADELRAARAKLKEARGLAKNDAAFQQAVRELDERSKIWHKALRATTPTYWGTYLQIEASMDQARKATVDPSFKRFNGTGRVGVQIQNGMTVDELFGGKDNRARIVPAEAKWQQRAKTARSLRHKVRHMLHLRVGSDGRAPIWAVFPLVMHREIPDGARIKGIVVRMRKIGLSERWTASLTYTREAVPLPQRAGVVAIDLGWRKRPDSALRVAYWCDDQGNAGEVQMPASIRERLKHANSLREIQDRRFNRTIFALRRWLERAPERLTVPPFLTEVQPYLDKWRAHQRLHRLIAHWDKNRFAGDARIFDIMSRWRTKSDHLYAWESHERSRALGHRREVYRIAAAQLARTYGTCVLEEFDLSKAKRLHTPEQGPDAPKAQRAQLQSSAPGELRLAVTQAMQREGGVVVKVSALYTTSGCHKCGGICKWDQSDEIWHTCEHCGALWDQDANAALNLLRIWKRDDAAPAAPKRVSVQPKKRRKSPDERATGPG